MTFPPLPDQKFAVIYADPPWDYQGLQHDGTSYTSCANEWYDTLRPAELKTLSVKSIAARKSILFLWVTGPQFEAGIDVMRAWGFRFRTVAFVWDKEKVNPGHYTLSQFEFVLAGTRGGIPKPRGARNVRQKLSKPRTIHSRKPAEIRGRIDQMFPYLRKIELFAAEDEPIERWTLWGKNHRK